MADRYLTPYQRIVINAMLGKGVSLAWWEVKHMALDAAIIAAAEHDDEKHKEDDTDG